MTRSSEWILVGVDFTDPGRNALRRAAELARERRASLLVLHVVEVEGLEDVARLAGIEPDDLRNRLRQHRQEKLASWIHGIEGIKVEAILVLGRPAPEILRKAREFAVDWIVLGSAGRSADAERMLFGSTAEKVMRVSPCPVLCVPL